MSHSRSTMRLFDAGLHAARQAYAVVAVLLVLTYLVSGTQIIEPGEVGLVRRFGQWVWHDGVVEVNRPGLLLAWPVPIDEVVRLPIKQELAISIDAYRDDDAALPESSEGDDEGASERDAARPLPVRYALTGDRSALHLRAVAKFRISDPAIYATSFGEPQMAVRKIVVRAITTTLSAWSVDNALRLQNESGSLPEAVLKKARERLLQTNLGVELNAIEFGDVVPPVQTRQVFLAVHEARVDQDAWREEAEVERDELLLTAETLALQFIADARGRRSSRLAAASSEAAAFQVALEARDGPLQQAATARLRHDTWREILRDAKHVFFVPESDQHGVLRLSLPEMEKSR